MNTIDTNSANIHEGSGPLYPSASCQEHDEQQAGKATDAQIDAACEKACLAIAPAWPLDRAIAVNPHWGRINRPLRQVAARMALLGNIQVFPTREYLREAWAKSRMTQQDLFYALATLQHGEDCADQCIDALEQTPEIAQLPLLIDVLDDDPARHTRLSWRQAITQQVSQTCAAFFDEHQADWQPVRGQGLYVFWRDTLIHDHGIGVLMGLPNLCKGLSALPATRRDAEKWVMIRLGLPHDAWADYLEAVLLTVNGWASWCAYLGWQAKQEGRSDDHLRDLLAIRLAWGAVLLECKTDSSAKHAFAALHKTWSHASELLADAERALWVDEVWQLALEAGYQRQLASNLSTASHRHTLESSRSEVEVQAAFCIDVRSERLRRALETASPSIQTIGFAGFFGLPIAYTPFATNARRPQLPGLLAPVLEVTDCVMTEETTGHETSTSEQRAAKQARPRNFTLSTQWQANSRWPGAAFSLIEAAGLGYDNSVSKQRAAKQARLRNFALSTQWQANSRWPGAAFSFVEAAGLGYLGKLAGWLRPSGQPRPRDDLAGIPALYRSLCRPTLTGLDVSDKVNLAATVLHAMGLDHDLAPLVLLVGHGSQSVNNAHAAALDCGACCGQTGEVNARVLAQLLNDTSVRAGLVEKNIAIPSETVFLAALHNTTTDEVEWFDQDLLPHQAQERLERVRSAFDCACDQVRRERVPDLTLDPRGGHGDLLEQVRRRANDGAQTRPEWGLAGNASFIIAPRSRTQHIVLDGRTFLHDYTAQNDPDSSILELLMTAPMLVTHWINWQYHASTCDPDRLGSGNKVLHNVVGGHIGVFEGNGGDLRIGLSKQSLHNGKQWMHEPLRLTVVIDAPRVAIERVIQQHTVVQQLINHGWLHLWHFGEKGLSRYAAGEWAQLGLMTQ
ncbi:MAG: DUF2309 domain-containing protein [Methylicorpusculum sp.]|uniref:YbcC family protein n=1 Tax=Methylicorpusculum sp. TaxID=2713644 RepID=UPI002730C182|nr:DUF2309 domain-containing protein [Methylicorpusculum sp.]MDP2178126.1 DUF2309 domain-containing protein [Methylicorpusculum sp.]